MIARNPPRFACPYCPTGVTFNDERYPTTISGELPVSWYHIHTETGITETSWTYVEADERLDSGLERLSTRLRITIRTWNVARTCGSMAGDRSRREGTAMT